MHLYPPQYVLQVPPISSSLYHPNYIRLAVQIVNILNMCHMSLPSPSANQSRTQSVPVRPSL